MLIQNRDTTLGALQKALSRGASLTFNLNDPAIPRVIFIEARKGEKCCARMLLMRDLDLSRNPEARMAHEIDVAVQEVI